jgi:soluble lytic murein transglycosylase-like protein
MIPDQWKYRYEAFKDTIKTASEANGIPVAIICAVIAQESSWREFCPARYEAGFQKKYINPQFPRLSETARRELASSYGPMQIMYVGAREIGFKGTVAELSDFKTGVEWGCRKLGKLFRKYKSGPAAIAAYNQGNSRWYDTDRDGIKDANEKYFNQGYVDSVMKAAREWEAVT